LPVVFCHNSSFVLAPNAILVQIVVSLQIVLKVFYQMATKNNIIAFQGVAGANSDMVCRHAYPYMETKAFPSFEDAMNAVESGVARLCMIPFENTKAGRVAEIHNLLQETNLSIVGEHFQRIEHQLMAPKGAKLADIKEIYSHPQALLQCKASIKKLGVTPREYSNTAVAAKDVAAWGDKTKAAIASNLAAELYGLDILKSNFEDAHDNTTIFIAMSKEHKDPNPDDGRIVTSLLFTARNIPASLYKALGGFATNHVNLLKIESYIPGGVSEMAQFFISFEGHPAERKVQLALEELGFFCKKVKLLGVYHADPKRFSS
jgi:prephenate dehydratase